MSRNAFFTGLFTILFLNVFSSWALAQNNVDVRVTENLNRLNFQYDIKEDGTFEFLVPLGDRTQMIFIHSNTSTYEPLEIRDIYSVIYQSPQAPGQLVLSQLLIDNGQKKLGAWELIFNNNTYYIVFTAKVSANMNDGELKSVIDIVATSADAMEQTLFKSDEW